MDSKRFDDDEDVSESLLKEILEGNDRSDTPQLDELTKKLILYARGLLRDEPSAEDIAQSALLVFVKYVREMGRGVRYPSALAKRIVHNMCVNVIRKRIRRSGDISIDDPSATTGKPRILQDAIELPDALLSKEETIQDLLASMNQLEHQEKAVIKALFFEKKTQREVANILNITTRTVYNIKERALSTLLKRIKEKWQ